MFLVPFPRYYWYIPSCVGQHFQIAPWERDCDHQLFNAVNVVPACAQVIYVKLSVVMGLGWVLGFVAAFTDWPALLHVFIVVNSLQGALLCVAFVATRQVMRLLADCIGPLCHRPASVAQLSSSQSPKSPTTPGINTEVARLSLIWEPLILFRYVRRTVRYTPTRTEAYLEGGVVPRFHRWIVNSEIDFRIYVQRT